MHSLALNRPLPSSKHPKQGTCTRRIIPGSSAALAAQSHPPQVPEMLTLLLMAAPSQSHVPVSPSARVRCWEAALQQSAGEGTMLYVDLSMSLQGGKGTCRRQAARAVCWREGEALCAFCN